MDIGLAVLKVGDRAIIDLTVNDLRWELGRRHLPKWGLKTELQQRLKEAILDEDWQELRVSH